MEKKKLANNTVLQSVFNNKLCFMQKGLSLNIKLNQFISITSGNMTLRCRTRYYTVLLGCHAQVGNIFQKQKHHDS